MSSCLKSASCAQPESLVLIELIPLCRIGVSDDRSLGTLVHEFSHAQERPLRCASVMSCAEAFALLEGVGHVSW